MILELRTLLMTVSNRGFRGRNSNLNGRSGTLPDNFGNRKTFDEVRIPPDNIGNKLDQDYIGDFVHDGLGNCVDEEPSHHKSGILARLALSGIKNENKRRRPERTMAPEPQPHDRQINLVDKQKNLPPLAKLHSTSSDLLGDQYIAKLNADFAKLLGQKSGLAFSFSMKPIGEADDSDEENTREELLNTKNLTTQILEANSIKATVGLQQYRTPAHHFAVFFIGPEEDEPARSKEMIAALRQVVSEYTQKMVKSSVNIFFVLANAKSVIEEHLFKIGAKKVE